MPLKLKENWTFEITKEDKKRIAINEKLSILNAKRLKLQRHIRYQKELVEFNIDIQEDFITALKVKLKVVKTEIKQLKGDK